MAMTGHNGDEVGVGTPVAVPVEALEIRAGADTVRHSCLRPTRIESRCPVIIVVAAVLESIEGEEVLIGLDRSGEDRGVVFFDDVQQTGGLEDPIDLRGGLGQSHSPECAEKDPDPDGVDGGRGEG